MSEVIPVARFNVLFENQIYGVVQCRTPIRKKSRETRFYINPLRAKLLRENINMYLHFMSFLHTNKTQVAEIPPGVRRRPAYST